MNARKAQINFSRTRESRWRQGWQCTDLSENPAGGKQQNPNHAAKSGQHLVTQQRCATRQQSEHTSVSGHATSQLQSCCQYACTNQQQLERLGLGLDSVCDFGCIVYCWVLQGSGGIFAVRDFGWFVRHGLTDGIYLLAMVDWNLDRTNRAGSFNRGCNCLLHGVFLQIKSQLEQNGTS